MTRWYAIAIHRSSFGRSQGDLDPEMTCHSERVLELGRPYLIRLVGIGSWREAVNDRDCRREKFGESV